MARSLQAIERDIQALAPTDRQQLLRDLIADMDAGEGSESIEHAWRHEAQQRLSELERGNVSASPAPQTFKRARLRLLPIPDSTAE
ncbi:addiction module protein [Algiphilus sp.]|uniref:addiction module protein n=1 Tax=Algiphilus sp. TaxID=1872431 RepID=UPI0032EDB847